MYKNNYRIPIRRSSCLDSQIFKILLLISNLILAKDLFAQSKLIANGTIVHFASPNTSFPELKRMQGYTYDSLYFDFPNHYEDSSVMAFVPSTFKQDGNTVDIVFWFHGWHNNIDTAINYYHLSSQFSKSDKNAILVLAEAAKNAPDSYGGKLEQPAVFKELLKDVLQDFKRRMIISPSCQIGNIILAGHSGAYRVIAYILQNGGVDIQEVDLFDALYSETDKFMQWIKKDTSNRFINLYTNSGGGTDEVSIQMMKELKRQNLEFLFSEEKSLKFSSMKSFKIIFIHSDREHNDIIFTPDNFRLFLENSPFLKNYPK
jgi:hypothetical protein